MVSFERNVQRGKEKDSHFQSSFQRVGADILCVASLVLLKFRDQFSLARDYMFRIRFRLLTDLVLVFLTRNSTNGLVLPLLFESVYILGELRIHPPVIGVSCIFIRLIIKAALKDSTTRMLESTTR